MLAHRVECATNVYGAWRVASKEEELVRLLNVNLFPNGAAFQQNTVPRNVCSP
jgi:hypothetical protein